jgi:site-specific recombinase XerD
MRVQSNLYILFWIKKNRLKNGKTPIYARVKIDGVRAEFSTNHEVPVLEWNSQAQFVVQKNPDAMEINKALVDFKNKLYQCKNMLEYKKQPLTLENIRNEFNGVAEKPRMLLEIIRQYVEDVKKLIGKDYVIASWWKYRATMNLVANFVQWKYKKLDIPLDSVKHSFITDFEFYLKTEKNINPSTNPKYIKSLRKMIRQCVVNEWLDRDPFLGYQLKVRTAERGFLTNEEIQRQHEKEFGIERLNLVRDLFLFSCYTGLSYIDIFNLTKDNISMGIDGKKWIFTHRQKTDISSRIPLLPPALDILQKYSNCPAALNRSKLLLIASNQKVNSYLKEIADCCGIKKKLTFHMARHTFATTITLSNGVPIESVSKMLGHTKIQTTQIYAKVLDEKSEPGYGPVMG